MSPEFGKRKLNLAFVEDPLLATAAANVMTPTQESTNAAHFPQAPRAAETSYPSSAAHSRMSSLASVPLTPPADGASPFDLSLKIPPPDSAVGDLDMDRFDEIQIDEQEPDINQPNLITHCKVYAIAEK